MGDEFIKNAKFGIFVHYTVEYAHLSPGKPRPAVWDLDAKADAFDVKAFADAVEGMSLESAWRACEGGDPSHGEKDQCCILPTENAWFLGKEVRIPAAEVFRGVVRCAGCSGQNAGVHVALVLKRVTVFGEK